MIWIMRTRCTSLYALALAYIAQAAPLYLDVRSTPSVNHIAFSADPSLDVGVIYAAAKKATNIKLGPQSYLTDPGTNEYVDIYGDWSNLPHVSAFHFMADMDIDCDGVDWNCPGNSGDGQKQTAFGALNATAVPWFVLPQSFADAQGKSLKSNALGAIICDGKMFYAIFGDTNGANPEVIGEGSLALGQACFQTNKIKISGATGHDQRDVAYIVFGQEVPENVGEKTIDLAALKDLGDRQVRLLAQDLNLKVSAAS